MVIQRIKLRQIADARSGDKGSSGNIGVIAHTPESFDFLLAQLTAERVSAYFQAMGLDAVERYELPNLLALNFVLKGVLGEGGSRSLRLDPQGKALGQVLLEMDIEVPAGLLTAAAGSLVGVDYPVEDVCVLTMKRANKRNALDVNILEQLCLQMEKAGQIPSLRALVLAAEGPAFCAGMDLNDAADPYKVERSAALLAAFFTSLREAPFVTIAAAQGVVAGGGAGLLSACDIAVAAENLTIAYPETRRGLVPAQVAPLLLRVAPRHLVHELLFCGEPLPAGRALALGLVNRVVPEASLLSEALKMAEAVKKSAPEAVRQTKLLLKELDGKSFADELSVSLPYHHRSRHSAEAQEGTRAFLEKRTPVW